MRPNPTCPVCDHGATDAASIRVHNEIAAERGCRVYPFGRGSQYRYDGVPYRYRMWVNGQQVPNDTPLPQGGLVEWEVTAERPAAWLNREFGAFAPALLGRVNRGDL